MYHLKCLQNVNKHYVHQIIRAKAIWVWLIFLFWFYN